MYGRIGCLFLVLLMVGCTEPTIEKDRPQESLSEVKAALSSEKLQAFEDAWSTVATGAASQAMGDVLSGESGANAAFDSYLERVDGMTAEEVIALADSIERARRRKERREAIARIQDLRAQKEKAERMSDSLAQFRVVRSSFEMREQRFGGPQPVIEMTVTNGTDHAVSRAYFDATLQSPGREVPWVEERFNYEASGGVEPGERQTWELAPNQFSEWGDVEERSDMTLTVEPFRLDGPDGEPLYETDWSDRQQEELQSLLNEHGEHVDE